MAELKLKDSRKTADLLQLLLVLVLVAIINILSSFVFTRIDLTAEKRYSLSRETKSLLGNLKDVVFVRVYLEGEFPAGFKKLRNSTQEMLDEFRVYADGNLEYEFINPSAGSSDKERKLVYNQLADKGLQPTNLEVKEGDGISQKIIFPGAILTYINQEFPVQLLKNRLGSGPDEMLENSVQSLEYELANAIRQLTATRKPRIAFDESHGQPDSLAVYDLSKTLSTFYDFERVSITGKIEGDSLVSSLKGFDLLIIAKPEKAFEENEKFLVDQFIMHGGRVLWMIDGMHATMDSLKTSGNTISTELALNLEDQLFNYGARINPNLVLDAKCAPIPLVTGVVGNQPRTELRPWLFFPLSFPESRHPLVFNLNAVMMRFASSIDTVGARNIKKTVLLSSSKFSKVVFTPARVSLSIARDKPQPEQFNKRNLTLSVLLEGEFRSLFTNRVPLELSKFKTNFRERSAPTKMILVGDGDIALNDVKRSQGQIYPLGFDIYTGQEYGNKNFVLNAVDYLCDDSNLISLRSKEIRLRLLDRQKIDDEKFQWQATNTLLPVVLLTVLGLLRVWSRRKKYVIQSGKDLNT